MKDDGPGQVEAKTIEIIEVSFLRGQGIELSPVRRVCQWWTFRGECLGERDPFVDTGEAGKETP